MNFKISLPIQLRFADTDGLGHVNNAVFLTYCEMARVEYFNKVLGDLVDWKKEGIILARTEMDYRLPIFLNDKPIVHIACSRVGTKSFVMSYRIEENGKVFAEGNTVMVCYNFVDGVPILMPESWKQKIADFEGDNLA